MANQSFRIKVGGEAAAQDRVSFALRLQNPADSGAQDFVVNGLMRIIRAGQQSDNPAVVALADEHAEFVQRMRDEARRVERIAFGMR